MSRTVNYEYPAPGDVGERPSPPYPGRSNERRRPNRDMRCCYVVCGFIALLIVISSISAAIRAGAPPTTTTCNVTAYCPEGDSPLPCFEYACLTLANVNYCVLAALTNCTIS